MSLDILDDQHPEGADPPAKPKRKNRRRAFLVIGIFGVLVALIVGIGAFYLITLNNALSKIKRDDSYIPPAYDSRPAQNTTEAINVMLLGSDSRGPTDQGRSDAMMWLHVPSDHSKIYIVSFTRDMWVDIPGYGKGKVNWAYAFGGVPLAVQTVETVVGARVDHVAKINFDGFIQLTTLLGGVTVENKYASGSAGYTFPKGQITVQGEEALAFVQERYALPGGAWSRAERQRDVVSAMIQKILSPAVLANPLKFNELADGVAQTLTVDSALSNEVVYSTAMSMRLRGGQDILSMQAPNTGQGMVGDQAVDFPNFPQLKELGEALRQDTMADYFKKYHPDR